MRLPVLGIGSAQVAPLLQGAIKDWRELGCPIPLSVSVIAIDGLVPDGGKPAETVADYAALVTALDKNPGAVAMAPIDQVDIQLSVLEIDGVNPLVATGTDDAPIVKVGVAGDIIFGRNGGNRQRAYGDFALPMYQVKDVLSLFDFTFANFECFVSETIAPPELTDPVTLDFVTTPDSLEGLVRAGIDAVSMANNHAVFNHGGFGIEAFFDTRRFLEEAGIPSFGVGNDLDEARAPYVATVNGMTIALYGVDGVTANLDYPGDWAVNGAHSEATASSPGTNPLVLTQVTADIERMAGKYDIVIPYFHMGEQYLWTPRDFAVEVSRACIDAGATLVVSSHPHTIQGMEIYKGKPIYYAIGNFVYDQMFSVDTRTGYLLDLTFRGKDVIGMRIHGVEIVDFVQPRFMSERENASLMDRFWRATDLLRREQ
ncbi:MAG TPA: CapA family protein [Thermomicrobiales bacterium]|nr:CapA family protein [Thermomicrobiales bacterium]